MTPAEIIGKLPYSAPFRFVDGLHSISEMGSEGWYTFKKEDYFYRGHFQNNPITPGVILTECMAQIGLVCLGIFLMSPDKFNIKPTFALSNTSIDFYMPVFPEERITVTSEKIYFRFNKLKCNVKMQNAKREIVAKGTISGMILKEILK